MANVLRGSPSVPHFTDQGPANPNSSSPRDIENTTVDQAAAEVLAAIRGKLLGIPDVEQTRELREKVFEEVLGRDTHGRVRTFGFGPCPTQIFGNKNKETHVQQVSDLRKVREDVREEVREEVREVVREEVREEMRDLVKEEMRDVILKELRDEFSREFTSKFEHFERHYAGLQDKGNKVLKSHLAKLSVPVQQVSDARSSQHHTKPIKCSPMKSLNVNQPKKIAAKGAILSKDPEKLERQYTGLQNKENIVLKSQTKPSIPVQQASDAQISHHESRTSKQVSDAESSHDESSSPKIRPLKVGMVFNLLNIAKPKKVVAEGTIVSMDPKKELDGVRLGDGFWIVRIDKVLNARENLLISRGDIRKLGQASNKNLFWRVPDIEVKKN